MSSDEPVNSEHRTPQQGEVEHSASRQGDGSRQEAIVLVRGEAVREQDAQSSRGESSRGESSRGESSPKATPAQEAQPRNAVSETKVKMQSLLPALGDDADVGIQKDHLVTRDGKADLAFTGTLLASAAPSSAPQGRWQEYRIYETSGGKHVFSKIGRNVVADSEDTHEAEIFDPAPSTVPSKLLRSARDLAHSRPMTWTDAAVAFFGYDPLAKTLYRKINGGFEEHIS